MTFPAAIFSAPIDVPGVLLATSNAAVRQQVSRLLEQRRWPMIEACGGADALEKLEASECRLLLMDERLPDLRAEDLASLIGDRFPGVDVLMLDADTGQPSKRGGLKTEAAYEMMRCLLSEPAESGETSGKEGVKSLPNMIGHSEAMQKVYRAARLVAPRDTSVLLVGESGTGKELVAEAVHQLSSRADKPLMTINCAAIPESLLESELFGYERGAFTGAAQSRIGRIHAAQGGTLFLDEIGEMPLSLQPKILRFLEQGEVQRLGSSDVFRVDVRLIAATNCDLERKVEQQQFRRDLLYRLGVFPIAMPRLKDRSGDVEELARHFLRDFAGPKADFTAAAMRMLLAHDWPGNVRELRHVIERATILADGAPRIAPEHIVVKMWGA
jgi:DNA-binding NtrC family response regulator